MLTAMFLSLGIGLLARRMGSGQRRSIIAIAFVVTVLYQLFGARFV